MHVGILGPLELTDGDAVIDVGGARLRALLARLALDAGRVVSLDSLSDALWPGAAPADPVNAVQSLVSRLRKVLPAQVAVVPVPGGYRLDVPDDAVDVTRFERLAADGLRQLRRGAAGEAATLLREALALWRGPALADVAGTGAGSATVARLDELRLTAEEDLVEAELAAGDGGGQLAARLRELVAANPLRERLRGLQVRALLAAGRRAEALAAFEAARRVLAEELGTDPGRELREAHLVALRSDDAGPVRGRGNVPSALTGLVGRDAERAAIRGRLAEVRLVTLVGPGGAGKTRLATEIGAELSGDIPGGVWMVELAALTDPDDVPAAVADALRLRDSGVRATEVRGDVVSRIIEGIAALSTVIVLDNCEHVIAAAAGLVEQLLGRCPGLRVVATSREPLGLVGESLYEVLPLGVPERGASPDVALDSPAVRLFAERARDVRADFTVDGASVAAVIEICRRLDGLPLAIELAAARLRSLPLEDLAGRLGERFEVLTRGGRTAPTRHRTLRDVVAWSWDLLTEQERQFLDRLAVVPTVTPDAAARVGGSAAAMDLLAALVDKSLVQLVAGAEPRYRMLETIREYALDRLAVTGRLAAAEAALVAYAADLAEAAEPHLRTADQLPWLARLRAERENLHAAVRFARGSGDTAAVMRLAAALAGYWTMESDHTQAARRLRQALDTPGSGPPGPRAVVAAFYLFNVLLAGEHSNALEIADRLRAWADAVRGLDGHPVLALLEPLLALLADEPGPGIAAADRQLASADAWTRGSLLLVRSMLVGARGDMVTATADLTAAVPAFGAAGERWGQMTSLTFMALMLTMFGDVRAASALEEAIELRRRLDPDDEAVEQRAWLAQLHGWTGQAERAKAELLDLVQPSGGTPARYAVFAHIVLGDLARCDGDLGEAGRRYDLAAAEVRDSGESMFAAVLASSMGQLAVARGDIDGAGEPLRDGLAAAVRIRDMPLVAAVAVGVAVLQEALGAHARAAEVLGAAHALRGAADALNPDVGRLTARLRSALGADGFATAYGRGRGLDGTAAVALIESYTRR